MKHDWRKRLNTQDTAYSAKRNFILTRKIKYFVEIGCAKISNGKGNKNEDTRQEILEAYVKARIVVIDTFKAFKFIKEEWLKIKSINFRWHKELHQR